MANTDNIKVVIKVRPLIKREKDQGLSSKWYVQDNTIKRIDSSDGTSFRFDKICDEHSTILDLYDNIARPIVQQSVIGFNGTIFAYGQTSSGKTHTMFGDGVNPGVTVLAIRQIFNEMEKYPERRFLLKASYIEIHNEKIYDLLNNRNELIVKEVDGEPKLGCLEPMVKTEDEIMNLMLKGNKDRKTAETNMNTNSSRSHTIFTITIESEEEDTDKNYERMRISVLNLVDLAGSERANATGATGHRLQEGSHINKSLLALSMVINKLNKDPEQFINYRDSKLTRILQPSLGGNSMTAIICTIKPVAEKETKYTLEFAKSAKSIKNKPIVNEVLSQKASIKRLKKRIALLEQEVQEGRDKNVCMCTKKQQSIDSLKERFIHYCPKPKSSSRRKTWANQLTSVEETDPETKHVSLVSPTRLTNYKFSDFGHQVEYSDEQFQSILNASFLEESPKSQKSRMPTPKSIRNLLVLENGTTSVAGSPVSTLDKDTRIKLLEEELEELRDFQQTESTLRSSDLIEIEALKEKLMKSDENVTKLQNELQEATNEIRANETLIKSSKNDVILADQTVFKEKEQITTKNDELKDILVQSQSEKGKVSIKHADEMCLIKANYENQLVAANTAIAAHIKGKNNLIQEKEKKFKEEKEKHFKEVKQMNNKIKNLETIVAQLSHYEDKIKSLNEDINKVNQLNGSLKIKINDLTDEKDKLNKDHGSDVVELNSRIEELKKAIATESTFRSSALVEIQALKEKLMKSDENANKLQSKLHQVTKEIRADETLIKSLKNDVKVANDAKNSAEQQLASVEYEFDQHKDRWSRLEKELIDENDGLKDTISSQNDQLNSKQLVNDDLRKALEIERNDLQQKQKRTKEIVEKLSSIESENQSLQEACNKAKTEIANHHQQQYQTLLKDKDEILYELLQNHAEKREFSIKHADELCLMKANYENQLVAANTAIAAHIEEIKLLLTDKASLQIQIDKVHGELNKSLKMIKAKNDEIDNVGLKQNQLENMVSECNVKIKNLEANAAQISDYKDTIKLLNEEINKLNQLNGSLKVQINDLTDENNKLNNDYDSDVVELNSRIDKLEKTIASQNDQLNCKQLASGTEQNDLQQKEKQFEEIVEKLSSIESENQALREACNKAKSEMANHQQQYQTLLKDKDELEDELLKSHSEQREMSIKHADELCHIKANYENQLFAANTAITAHIKEKNNLTQEKEKKFKEEKEKHFKEVKQMNVKIKNLETISAQLSDYEDKIKSLNEEINKLNQLNRSLEIENNDLTDENDSDVNSQIDELEKAISGQNDESSSEQSDLDGFNINESQASNLSDSGSYAMLSEHTSELQTTLRTELMQNDVNQEVDENLVTNESDNKKRFECDICNRGFTAKQGLQRHISSFHKGEKPFECEFCNRGFTQKGHLNVHISAVHKGEKPFECEFCNKRFSLNSNLKVHIKTVHNSDQ